MTKYSIDSRLSNFCPTDEDIDFLRSLEFQKGWVVYQNILKRKFVETYKKLRSCKRDGSFYKTQGILDALEFALETVSETITENRKEADNNQ